MVSSQSDQKSKKSYINFNEKIKSDRLKYIGYDNFGRCGLQSNDNGNDNLQDRGMTEITMNSTTITGQIKFKILMKKDFKENNFQKLKKEII